MDNTMIKVEIYIPKDLSSCANAWLWHHPDIDDFVCGIELENMVLRTDDLRLFKAITQETNIAVFNKCGTKGDRLTVQDIDAFIEKYQAKEPNDKTTT